jgi:HTH domain
MPDTTAPPASPPATPPPAALPPAAPPPPPAQPPAATDSAEGSSGWPRTLLRVVIGLALTGVMAAPLALSSGELIEWAGSASGLGKADPWPMVVFIALDCAAILCIGFVVFNAWTGEGAGMFGLLVWLFAGGSAVANYRYGQHTSAPDDAVFFAAMSLAGPLLLHTTVHRIRRWYRASVGENVPRRAHFGLRWFPGVDFRGTLAAWQESVRAGLPNSVEAINRVRERAYLQDLDDAGRVRYAVSVCRSQDPAILRTWLLSRGLDLKPAVLEEALWAHLAATAAPPPTADTTTSRGRQRRQSVAKPATRRASAAATAGSRRPGQRPLSPEECRQAIRRLWEAEPGISNDELAARLKVANRTIERRVQELRDAGVRRLHEVTSSSG